MNYSQYSSMVNRGNFGEYRFNGKVEWNGTVEWNSGMVEWNSGMVEPPLRTFAHAHASALNQRPYTATAILSLGQKNGGCDLYNT